MRHIEAKRLNAVQASISSFGLSSGLSFRSVVVSKQWYITCFVCGAKFFAPTRERECPRCQALVRSRQWCELPWSRDRKSADRVYSRARTEQLSGNLTNSFTELPPELADLVLRWQRLAPHIREAILTLTYATTHDEETPDLP